MQTLSYREACVLCGYLEKKSPSMFGGWQKRYFKIIEGKVLTYSEKEKDKEFKGSINLVEVSGLKSTDKKCFKFDFGERTWELRAESDEQRDNWVNALTLLLNEINNNKSVDEEIVETRSRGESKTAKIWKKNQQDVNTMDLLKKSGFNTNKDDELSEKAIRVKFRTLNPDVPEIRSRIQYGFLMKKHKSDYLFQKRWLFLISSRPVNDIDYEKDDWMVYKNPSGIHLDTLYYYCFENETDESKFKGEIPMSDCSEIAAIDKENKFFLIVDIGDRKYEFESEIKAERDKWYSCLRNSRRTAKEIKKSVTKKPRNICRLSKIIENEGVGKLREVCESEKDNIVQNYKDIKEFDLLDGYYIKNLQDILYQTLDGCVLSDPPKTDVIKTYVETFNSCYLVLIKQFWKDCYSNMDQSQIVKLATLLFTHEDTLSSYGVIDPNFSQNARELIKIFIKKTFMNVKTIIESILKNEREVKALKSPDHIFITNGPLDLFKMLYSLIDVFKKENYRVKYIMEQFLYLCKECILQYLMGVDCVVSRCDLDIDKEFLLAVANNSIKINSQFEDLLDEIKFMKILTDKEVEDASGSREISSSLTIISNSSISRFVQDLSDALMDEFEDHFLTLDISNILEITFQTYGSFMSFMHISIQKKCWNEILKATLFLYIKSLLTTAHKKVKKIDDLTSKLRNDREILLQNYVKLIGENLTNETLRILDDFLDFLDVSPMMISVSCTKLREFNGPSFTLNTAKALINLRCDLSKEEKNEAIDSCKDVFVNFSKNPESLHNLKSTGFFENLEQEIENQVKLEKLQEESEKGLDEVMEPSNSKDRRKTFKNLSDFLNIGVDVSDFEDEEDKKEEMTDFPKFNFKSSSEKSVDTDVITQGTMKKKTYSVWQERYFQIKNDNLYWYKTSTSKEAQNSIAIKDMKKVQVKKSDKFLMVVGEKIYKFQCKTEEDRDSWVKALNNEIKRIKGDSHKKLENIYEIKLKKKIIEDYYNLPNISAEKLYMKKKVDEAIKSESFFADKKKAKPTVKLNKKLISAKTQMTQEIFRTNSLENITTHGSSRAIKSEVSPLNIGLIDRRPKINHSIFACCNKLLAIFNKKSTDDYV